MLDQDGASQIEPLRAKFVATTREWEQTTRDADMLEEELKEEKVGWADCVRHAQVEVVADLGLFGGISGWWCSESRQLRLRIC